MIDATLLVCAVGFGALMLSVTAKTHTTAGFAIDVTLGLAACGSLPARRSYPVHVAIFSVLASAVSAAAAGASLVALFGAAVRVRPWLIIALTGAELLATFLFPLLYPGAGEFGYPTQVIMGSLLNTAVVGWGLMARAQRSHFRAIVQHAHDLEIGQKLLAANVRDQERRRIAREMHDVLAHRLSILSVHAGALEFRSDLSAEQTRKMAGIIRRTTHIALEELHEVIGVLRDERPDAGSLLAADMGLADLATLIEEARSSGTEIGFDRQGGIADHPGTKNHAAGTTAYRIVQEGLTNARKHAPGSPVHVTVRASGPGEIFVEVNTLLRYRPAPTDAVPGAGTGLSGLGERVSLTGGEFSVEETANRFVIIGRLPWVG